MGNTLRWLGLGLLLAAVLGVAVRAESASRPAARESGRAAYEDPAVVVAETPLDRIVKSKLSSVKIPPAKLCSDGAFLRRSYLAVIGTIPTADEAREFLRDSNPRKRALLIDQLLARDEYADYWAMKHADWLRVKAEFPINLWPNAVQAYHRWLHTALRENKPLDKFARELLTASGSNFRCPEANFYRAVQSKTPEGIAQTVALTFMGSRLESWPKDRAAGLAAFFTQVGYKATGEWKEEIVYWERAASTAPATAPATRPALALFPDGTPAKLTGTRDPREVFADWLLDPKNPQFARATVNRLWFWVIGRGIVHEPDDMRPGNPPSNPELLAYLEREFVACKYDMKHMLRLILNSQTYQRSCLPTVSGVQRGEAEANFAHYPLCRLEAEVLIDALCQITGTREKYTSPIPEPFTFIPEDHRSVSLADGSITSTFLELFGRPPRDSGYLTERNSKPSDAQRLHLLNSSHIQRKIEQGGKLQKLIGGGKSPRESVNLLYLTILSRYPGEDEMTAALNYVRGPTTTPTTTPATQRATTQRATTGRGGVRPGAGGGAFARRREGWIDLAWALINSTEFQYRH